MSHINRNSKGEPIEFVCTNINLQLKAMLDENKSEHDLLCEKAGRWLKSINCYAVIIDPWCTPMVKERPDAIGWLDGLSFLVEVKTSRADFLSDKKKPFRQSRGMGDWRFYMCPEGLIKPEELPEGWGLIWVKNDRITEKFNFPSNCSYHLDKPFIGDKGQESIFLSYAFKAVKDKRL